jgi:HD-GYP domain-containing protein (c-di-GMP phosphodiesterase class II)
MIGIDDAVLRKPGKLTADEFAMIQQHAVRGAETLQTFPELRPVVPIVRSHHERWDGAGYPDRLAGEDIPYLARVVAVADVFDALTSPRPYHMGQKGRAPSWAFGELEQQAGRIFDPRCAAAFLSVRDRVVRSMMDLTNHTETMQASSMENELDDFVF